MADIPRVIYPKYKFLGSKWLFLSELFGKLQDSHYKMNFSMGYHATIKNPIEGIQLKARCNIENSLGKKKPLVYMGKPHHAHFFSLGNKPYLSPEYSFEFFHKEGTVVKMQYGPPLLKNRKSIKEQLGPVNGIFTTILKLPAISKFSKRNSISPLIFSQEWT